MWEKHTTDTGQSYDTVSELPRPAHRRNRDTSDGSDCGSLCLAFVFSCSLFFGLFLRRLAGLRLHGKKGCSGGTRWEPEMARFRISRS
jgi:hypothetical protein